MFRKILKVFLASMVVAMLVLAFSVQSNTTYVNEYDAIPCSDGWHLVSDMGEGGEISLPYAFETEMITIKNTLPRVHDHSVLLVKCNYKTMTASVDGKVIYESDLATLGLMKTDVGHYIAMIPLSEAYSGKEISLTIEERSSGYNTNLKHIHISTVSNYMLSVFEEKVAHLIVSILLYILAVVACVIWIIVRKKNFKDLLPLGEGMKHVALVSACVGTWIATDTHIFAIKNGTFAVSGILNYVSLMLLPLAILLLLRTLATKRFLLLDVLTNVGMLVLFLQFALFLFGVCDLSFMLIFTHACLIASVFLFAFHLIVFRKHYPINTTIIAGVIIFVAFVLASILSYFKGGYWIPLAIIAVICLLSSFVVSTMITIVQKMRELSENIRYREFAMKDVMTGLGSRLAFSQKREQYLSETPPEDLALIFMDVNGLKSANDLLGHFAGDELIIATANCISESFVDSECYRMGGDEFLVMLRGSKQEIESRLARFRENVAAWCGEYSQSLKVACGVVYMCDQPGTAFDILLRKADENMYTNKKNLSDNP